MVTVQVITLAAVFHIILGMSRVNITQGPENVTVVEGESASFPCFTAGTTAVPYWYISSSLYTTRGLPSRHYYFNWTLTVTDVQLSDDQATYQCSLFVVSSKIAVLTVVAAREDSLESNYTESVSTGQLINQTPTPTTNQLLTTVTTPSHTNMLAMTVNASSGATAMQSDRSDSKSHTLVVILCIMIPLLVIFIVISLLSGIGYLRWHWLKGKIHTMMKMCLRLLTNLFHSTS